MTTIPVAEPQINKQKMLGEIDVDPCSLRRCWLCAVVCAVLCGVCAGDLW